MNLDGSQGISSQEPDASDGGEQDMAGTKRALMQLPSDEAQPQPKDVDVCPFCAAPPFAKIKASKLTIGGRGSVYNPKHHCQRYYKHVCLGEGCSGAANPSKRPAIQHQSTRGTTRQQEGERWEAAYKALDPATLCQCVLCAPIRDLCKDEPELGGARAASSRQDPALWRSDGFRGV